MDYLVQHAIDNVWCSPRQDRQYITRPKRISKNGGEVVQIESDWLEVYLPDNQHYYHVYQIGNLHPDFLGLFPVQNRWVSLSEVCNKMGMIADLYSIKGFLLPKFETYYMVTRSRNLIIATRKREELFDIKYSYEDLYFRVYTNSFFQSPRSNNRTERVLTKGYNPKRMEDILAIQTEFNVQRAKPVGYAWAIINGFFYEEISPFTCKIGDVVDWVYDSSVQKVVEYEIDKLPAFDSLLDKQRKYLLHYPGNKNQIEYQDDVDLFLIERPAIGRANGLFHHQNTEVALRMVTHKDYAMSVQLVNSFVDGHPRWKDPSKLRVLALIRESGYARPLVFENSRIHELYKLNEKDILPAMTGEYAMVPVWKAAALEKAQYPLIMRQKKYTDITRPMVQAAYGYNAISKVLGDTPMKVKAENGQRLVDMPRGLYQNATAFEYDVNGLLLGWYHHAVGQNYIVNNAACVLVEAISGRASRQLDEAHDAKTHILSPVLNYRMYICDKIDGISQNNWRDVTGSGLYSLIDNRITWLINLNNFRTLVRSDANVLVYLLEGQYRDGLIDFTLTKNAIVNGQLSLQYQEVPMGEHDIFLNGRSLTYKTDYVQIGSRFIIHNKAYLIDPENQKQQIVVRASGFCKADLSVEIPEDVNFVKWDMLSRNSAFNLRDDRVMRIVVDGRLYHRDSLKFSEKDQAYLLPNARNGDPYSIRDIVVPMRSLTDGDTYSLREQSRVIDRSVSEYLSVKLPESVPSVPNVIPERYPIYTPFLCKILYDLVDGVIQIDMTKAQYSQEYVREICAPYEYILAFDPTQAANTVNDDYVIIHPHHHNNVMRVDIHHFNFLQQANVTYTGGKVVLNHFLRLV